MTLDVRALFVKRARGCKKGIVNFKQPTDVQVLLRRFYFLNEKRTLYVSVGFYPSENYKVLVDFGGPRIVLIRLTELQVRTLIQALPQLCDAMLCCELYTRKDGVFRIRSRKT